MSHLDIKRAFQRAFINCDALFLRYPGTASEFCPPRVNGEFQTVEKYDPAGQYGSKICAELDRGSKAFVFVDENGQVAHYAFVADKKVMVGEIRRYLYLPEKSIFIYNCYTDDRFRRRGIFKAMLQHIINSMPEHEKYIHVVDKNRASKSVIKNAGFEEIGHVFFRRIVFFEQCRKYQENSRRRS